MVECRHCHVSCTTLKINQQWSLVYSMVQCLYCYCDLRLSQSFLILLLIMLWQRWCQIPWVQVLQIEYINQHIIYAQPRSYSSLFAFSFNCCRKFIVVFLSLAMLFYKPDACLPLRRHASSASTKITSSERKDVVSSINDDPKKKKNQPTPVLEPIFFFFFFQLPNISTWFSVFLFINFVTGFSKVMKHTHVFM